ncbi:hypothetical protein O6H91_08G087600 [Diphasiastrum complanatum]|nr:hypothetical protein O6H91_08G087600 [Diphasiastrum complanatum]
MHDNFDEEVSFEDEPVYVINQENLEELLSVSKSVVVFHKHMKGATAGWNTDGPTPLRIRLQKGLTGTRSDLYATIEYFFYDGTEEEHGEVKMVCRPIAVLECDGSKLQERKGCCYFELNKSKWLPVVHLNSDKCQRLTDEEWKKKVMELENKQPGYIEILNEEESKYFNVEQALPNFGAKFQAGYFLPKSFLVAVRPRQGFGPTHKQGMIVAESLEMKFLLSFSLLPIGTKRSKEATVSRLSSDPGDIDEEVLAEHIVQGSFSRNGVKGIYLFNTKDLKLPEQLTSRGFYVFRFSLIGENYKNVRGACCSVQIIPSETTSRWSICSHLGNCDSLHPKEVLRPVFRLKGQLEEPLYLSKYDEFNNQQTFEGPLELKVALLTVMEKRLHIEAVFRRESICLTDDKLHAKLKNIALGKGKLHSISESYNAILRFYLPNDKTVDLNVKVLPGKLYEVLVKESYPRVSGSPLFYDESLRPGDIIEKLVLQGYDEFGNVVDDGQILKLKLDGLELLDKTFARQVDNLGCVHLEGILKVTSHFNTEGYIVILSEDGSELLQISFRVVTRILQFVNKVPKRFYVGRHLEGLEIEIVDQNGVVDTSVEGPMNTLALSWTNSITCPLRSGRCSLPTIELPKVPGLWKGEVSHSFNPELKLEFQVEVELAVAKKLAALSESEREQKVWEAHCGEPFKLPFIALDDLDQLAVIPKGIVKQLSLRVERQEVECEFGDVHLEQSKAQRGADGMFYEVQLTMSGQEGLYKILAECPNPFAESKPGLGPISWMVNLYPGFVVKLAPVISKGEWLPHELKEATGDPISSILVPRCSMFPVLDVYLLDSSQNICSYYEGSQLALEILNCVQWVPKFTNVSNGHGTFGAFQLDLAIGSYELKVTIHTLNGSEPPLCHEAQINLQVTHGNYPSALKLLTDETIVFNLEGNSRQFLPVMELLVESADGLPLKKDFRPILRFMDNAEYYGDLVEFSSLDTPGDGKCNKICCAEPFQEMSGQHSCVRKGSVFSFSHVHAPSRSDTYPMVFSLSDTEISSVSLTLTVKHGPPAKVDFFEEQHGHEIHMLKVKVVDAHGNQCIEVNGAKLRAELIPTNGFMVEQQDIGSCVLLSTTAATVENGEACFGDVHLGEGMEGIYCLRVFEEDNLLNLTAGSAQLIVIRGKTMLEPINRIKDRSEKLVQLIQIINKVRKEIQSEQEKKASLESSVTALQEELRKKVKKHDEVEKDQKAFLDDEILDRERHQENRSEEDVIADFRRLASGGNGVSLAFWEARLSRNFLSPSTGKPEADDIIGQVVMLARVEGDPLNRILSEYIGLSTLLLIVCKSQQGIQALEAYDSNGDVDETKGLYGFAHSRGYKISGRYQAICLSDIKPYRHPDGQDPVDLQHCQNLLRIPPPVTSSGRHLTGFLGYAVNLLHLKEEHLSISIKGRCVGLRETLFFSLFSTLQVYDSRKNMYLAKDSCKRFHGGAVSLDGSIIRSNLRQELGKHRNHVPVRFPLVPFEERIKLSLLPPTCHAFQRSKLKRELTGNVDTLHTQISCELADIEKINSNIADLSNNVQILEVQIQNIQNKVGELKAEVLNYKKAHDSVFLDKHDDDDRLRVLMM